MSGGKGGGSSKSHGPKLSVQTGAAQVESLETRIKNELIGLGLFDPPEVSKLFFRSSEHLVM